jgi:cytochrome c553
VKRLLKWIAYVVGGLVAVVLLFVGFVYARTSLRMARSYSTETESLTIPTDQAAIDRGHHLVLAVGKCVGCHGDNLGGKIFADEPIFARFWASNLTRGKGGIGSTYTDQDYVRAIRYGVRSSGKPLIFMPSEAFNRFNDADLADIIAYVKSVRPVDQVTPPPMIGPIARVISTIGDFPLVPAEMINRQTARPASVPAGVTKEYGDYLITAGGCRSCHNQNLSGGNKIENVMTANLTPTGIGKWTEADFVKALREGVRPDGRILSAVMPWPYTKNLTDDEISAMWMYLRTLQPRETGS